MSVSIIKLGGSLITNKDKPLTLNKKAIKGIAKVLGRSDVISEEKLILIHGGGSFGHYYAKKFELGTKYSKASPEAVARTCSAMAKLHSVILESFAVNGLYCKTIDAGDVIENGSSSTSISKNKIEDCFKSRLIPISYGNVKISSKGARIISGDELSLALTKGLTVKKVIFAMDVDGIYPDQNLKGDIIPLLADNMRVGSKLRKWDTTGGVKEKLKLGFEISKLGADVHFVNGLYPGRIVDALNGNKDFTGTTIRASSGTLKE